MASFRPYLLPAVPMFEFRLPDVLMVAEVLLLQHQRPKAEADMKIWRERSRIIVL